MGLGCPISGGGGGGGTRRRVRRGRRVSSAGNTEPVENIISLDRDIVVYTSSTDSLEVRSVSGASPAGQRRVLLGRRRGLAVAENVGPLLNTFTKVVVIESSVTRI